MRNVTTILCSLFLVTGLGCVLPDRPYEGDDDDNDDTGSDDDATGDDDTGDDDTGDDDTGDDDTGDDDTSDDDTGDDDTGISELALLIEDMDPWESGAWPDAFQSQGIPYTVIGSQALDTADLTQYDMVVTSSVQGDTYNQRLLSKMGDFQSYVAQGGVLVWSGATWADQYPYPDPPLGGTSIHAYCDTNTIVAPNHPLMDGVQAPFTGDYASHNYFLGVQEQAEVVLADPESGEATLYTLVLGQGLLIVSGLPWEAQGGAMADTMQTLANAAAMGWGYP